MIIKHFVAERILEEMGFTIYRHVYQFWENLPKFKDACSTDHVNVMELERQQMANNYKMEVYDRKFMKDLKGGQEDERKIVNSPWYRVLSTTLYQQRFGYTPPHFKHRLKDDDALKDKMLDFILKKTT